MKLTIYAEDLDDAVEKLIECGIDENLRGDIERGTSGDTIYWDYGKIELD